LWTRGLLIRRHLADGACAYFTTWCPAGTGIETLVAVEGQRWTIEDSFETGKNELGLDHNETRSWHGWHRHVSLVMLAFARLATIRHHANREPPQKTPLSTIQRQNQPSSTGRPRKSAVSPCSLHNGASSLPMSLPGRSGGGPIKPPQDAHT
jgi:SRSO17 transposase